ncbi:MAG TPA: hypothetical protein VM054_05055 [bacterium]|nr:hypothetical protein [bacterium]
MPLGKPRDLVTYPNLEAKNLTPGEGDNAAKRVDGLYFDANNKDANNALAVRQGFGVDFVDNGSIVGECRVTTPAGLFDAEHKVTIGDGTRVWKTAMTADDDLRFDDTDIVNGAAGPGDYSTAAFIDSLVVWSTGSDTVSIMVDNTEIVLVRTEPNALTADDIARSPANAEVVDTSLTNIETAFDVEHDGATGVHDDGFLDNIMVNADECFINEGFKNLVDNSSFEFWDAGIYDIPPTGWTFTGGATSVISQEATIVHQGAYSCKIHSLQNGDMLSRSIVTPGFYANKTLAGYVYLQGAVGRIVDIYLWGTASGVPGTIVTWVLTGGWDRVPFYRVMGADADIQLRIVRNDGTDFDFYVDTCMIAEGRLKKAWAASESDLLVLPNDSAPYNWLLNPNFDIWQETAEVPMAWEPFTGVPPTVARNATAYFGSYSLSLTCAVNGLGISQRIGGIAPVLAYLAGKTVTYSVWVLRAAAASTIYRMQIDDGVGTTENDTDVISYGAWTCISVTRLLDAAPTKIDCNFFRNDAAHGTGVLISNACLNIGSRPLDVIGPTPNVWAPRDYLFWCDGTCATGAILNQRQEMMEVVYPLYLSVFANLGPGMPAPDTCNFDFKLYNNAADTGFLVNLANKTNAGHEKQVTLAAADADILGRGDHIHIQALENLIGADPSDIRVVLRAYTLSL